MTILKFEPQMIRPIALPKPAKPDIIEWQPEHNLLMSAEPVRPQAVILLAILSTAVGLLGVYIAWMLGLKK